MRERRVCSGWLATVQAGHTAETRLVRCIVNMIGNSLCLWSRSAPAATSASWRGVGSLCVWKVWQDSGPPAALASLSHMLDAVRDAQRPLMSSAARA
jgi:hypothetical protein